MKISYRSLLRRVFELLLLLTNKFRHMLDSRFEPIVLTFVEIAPDGIAMIAEPHVYSGKVTTHEP